MNYFKRFQHSQTLSFSVGNFNLEYQMMHTFLDIFHQGGKYSAQIDSHQAKSRRGVKSTDQKYLSTSSLQTNSLYLDIRLGFGRNGEKSNTVYTKCTFGGGFNQSAENGSKGSDKKRKSPCGWEFGKQANITNTSEMFWMWI